MDVEVAAKRLAALHAATSLADLTPLKAIGLHKLAGSRRDQWAVAINGPWRVCFRFKGGDAWDVEIVDYH
jgi:toxin HigB-1